MTTMQELLQKTTEIDESGDAIVNSFDEGDISAVKKYLSSPIFRGIGLVIAGRIVSEFGIRTSEIIGKSVSDLRRVEGIGEKRILIIQKGWLAQPEIREAMLFLCNHGLSFDSAHFIVQHYGEDTIDKIKANPYQLIQDCEGIGFVTVDKLALELGFPIDSDIRIEAWIIHILILESKGGHMYCPKGILIKKCMSRLSLHKDPIVRVLSRLEEENNVVLDSVVPYNSKFTNEAVYLRKLYDAEVSAAIDIKRILGGNNTALAFDIDLKLRTMQEETGITMDEEQYKAVRESCFNKILIITGGPGTGKSTIIKTAMRLYENVGMRVLLAAPTGKAAKRLSEVTGREALTIHRLLEYSPNNGMFTRNERNQLDADVLILDEFSMVDLPLFRDFLKAVHSRMRIVIVGDYGQLPSIGPGAVLRDLIASGVIRTVILTNIYRQAGNSAIVENAHRINEGKLPWLGSENGVSQDFHFFEVKDPRNIADAVAHCCRTWIPQKFKMDQLDDIQVLSPMRKGRLGTFSLNNLLQSVLNKNEDVNANSGRETFLVGDKVMQISNNYEKKVFNGDIGFVMGIEEGSGAVSVNFDGRQIYYRQGEKEQLVLAYAVTVHKYQGSECPAIVMVVHEAHRRMLQRNLLYTAITRGRKIVVLIGTVEAVTMAVRNDRHMKRYSNLKQRLINTLCFGSQINNQARGRG